MSTINREAAIDSINELHELPNAWLDLAVDTLEKLPSVQPEQKKAIWALHTYMPHKYYCTHCKKDSPYNKTWSYCPNCGCEMEGYV